MWWRKMLLLEKPHELDNIKDTWSKQKIGNNEHKVTKGSNIKYSKEY